MNCKDCGRFRGNDVCTCVTDKLRSEIRESKHVDQIIAMAKQNGDKVMFEQVWGREDAD